jgi:hypothetical protein
MGQVNGRRESRALESASEPPAPVQGAQASAKNGRIPGLFMADQQTERLSAWAMLAERAGFELSVRTVFQALEAHTAGLARARPSHIDAAVE